MGDEDEGGRDTERIFQNMDPIANPSMELQTLYEKVREMVKSDDSTGSESALHNYGESYSILYCHCVINFMDMKKKK